MRFAAALATIILGVLVGCEDSGGEASPSRTQLDWVLHVINGNTAIAEDPTQHFTPAYLEDHPGPALISAFGGIHDRQAPLALRGFDGDATATHLLALTVDKNQRWMRIDLTTEDAPPHRIASLGLYPNGDADPALTTWDAVVAKIGSNAKDVGFVAGTIGEAGCTPIAALSPDAELSIGSNLKLYILSALARRIADGQMRWTDPVVIADAHKSLSPLEFETDGTTFTVREMAEKMIAGSDNSAADHLLAAVGRDAVEAAVVASGHSAPALDAPFLSTWEYFAIAYVVSADERATYLAATPDERRAKLATLPRGSDARSVAADAVTTEGAPTLLKTLGWFASANDLCRVVHALEKTDAIEILYEATGLPDPRGEWSRRGYKAGSANGILSTSYLLERRRDGRRFFTAMIMNDPGGAFDREEAFYLLGAVRGLLAKYDGG